MEKDCKTLLSLIKAKIRSFVRCICSVKCIWSCIKYLWSIAIEIILHTHPLVLVLLLFQVVPIYLLHCTDQGKEIVSIFFDNLNNKIEGYDAFVIPFFTVFFIGFYILYIKAILILFSFRFAISTRTSFHVVVSFTMLILPLFVGLMFIVNSNYLAGCFLLVVLSCFIKDYCYNTVPKFSENFTKVSSYKPLIYGCFKLNKDLLTEKDINSIEKVRFVFPALLFVLSIIIYIKYSDFTVPYLFLDQHEKIVKWLVIIVVLHFLWSTIKGIFIPIIQFVINSLKGKKKGLDLKLNKRLKFIGFLGVTLLLYAKIELLSQSLFSLVFGFIVVFVAIIQLFMLVDRLYKGMRFSDENGRLIIVGMVFFLLFFYSCRKDDLHHLRFTNEKNYTESKHQRQLSSLAKQQERSVF